MKKVLNGGNTSLPVICANCQLFLPPNMLTCVFELDAYHGFGEV
jgi:hypothetical protein